MGSTPGPEHRTEGRPIGSMRGPAAHTVHLPMGSTRGPSHRAGGIPNGWISGPEQAIVAITRLSPPRESGPNGITRMAQAEAGTCRRRSGRAGPRYNTCMGDRQLLARIHANPGILTGKPVIRGTRLSVDFILNLLAHGSSFEEILEEYEGLEREDILACLLFATRALEDASFMPLIAETA
jgi:uncharacterized protein (DUF433 family)